MTASTTIRSRVVWTALALAVSFVPQLAQAQQRRVDIDSAPQGATVHLDTETSPPLGVTPVRRVRIPTGTHTLFFTRDGYIPGRLDINVTRSRETFSATLTQGGSIYVSADIDGAQVFLDGNAVGTTPGRINNVTPGQHIVEVRQQGMQTFRDTVAVGAGAVASVNASLRPPPPVAPPTGIVHVIVTNPNGALPPDLQVAMDGTPLTGSPPGTESAPPGTHILQVSANGFRSVRREITVTAGQTFTLAIDLDAVVTAPTGGIVRVITNTQGAQVFLDGEIITPPAAGGPAVRENVPAGSHSLRVSADGRSTVTQVINVTVGQTTAVEIPDLATATVLGRLIVRSPTPNAQVFIDGRPVGPSPYERADMPAGNYTVTVRADGFDDRNQPCTVAPQTACDVSLPLTRTVGHAALHVELARPVQGAVLVIDGNPLGEIGAGRDVPQLSATTHEIRVQAQGFMDYVESVTLQENEQHRTMVMLRRNRRGPSGPELAQRRAAISTFGGSPLAPGDAALDFQVTIFGYVGQVRGTIGLFSTGIFGLDAGFGIRSNGPQWELEVRARPGIRGLDGLVAAALDIRGFAGFGIPGNSNFGMSGFLVGSIHSLGPTPDEVGDTDDPHAAGNRAGSIAFSLRLGFEALSDGLSGLRYSHVPAGMPTVYDIPPCTTPATTTTPIMPAVPGAACGLNMPTNFGMPMGTDMSINVKNGSQNLVRGIAGATLEIGLGRNVNLFFGLDRVLGDNSNVTQQRVYFQQLWGSDSFTYIYGGLTYKF